MVMLASVGGAGVAGGGAAVSGSAERPERLGQRPLVALAAGGLHGASELLLLVTLAFAAAAVLAALIRLTNLWLNGGQRQWTDRAVRPTGARSISPMGYMCSATARL